MCIVRHFLNLYNLIITVLYNMLRYTIESLVETLQDRLPDLCEHWLFIIHSSDVPGSVLTPPQIALTQSTMTAWWWSLMALSSFLLLFLSVTPGYHLLN